MLRELLTVHDCMHGALEFDDQAFVALRDKILAEKREKALGRHQLERVNYGRWLVRIREVG